MDTQTQTSFSWLRQISAELHHLDETPLLGFPPDFPWKAFSDELSKSLQIPQMTIAPGNLQWRSEAELLQGLGDRLKTLCISVGPLTGAVWWVMPEQGLTHLMHLLLSKDSSVWAETIDDSFSRAFYLFLAAEAVNAFEKTGFDKKLIPTINKETTLPNEACLGLDIGLNIGKETLYGRLLISQAFRKSWMQFYTKEQQGLPLSSPHSDHISVIVHLEAGKVSLKPSEWKQLHPGDFVLLDSCSLHPDEDKGRVMLVINGFPFFHARIKEGSLKVLEHPLYHEVNTPMDTPPKSNNHDHDPEETFDESLDDADFEFDDDDLTPHTEVTNHDESGEHQEDHTDHDIDLDISDEDLSDIHETHKEAPAPSAGKKTPTPSPAANKPLSIEEIPLNVVIELGRIQMSVKKLLELQPGNTLDINIHPESGVDMVVNGKRIAHGELLKIGDSLGIRILELS